MIDERTIEALGILQEEAAEVIKEVSKVRRSGAAFRPFGGDKSNWDNLQEEVYDFLILAEQSGLSLNVPTDFRERKYDKLKKWSTLFR